MAVWGLQHFQEGLHNSVNVWWVSSIHVREGGKEEFGIFLKCHQSDLYWEQDRNTENKTMASGTALHMANFSCRLVSSAAISFVGCDWFTWIFCLISPSTFLVSAIFLNTEDMGSKILIFKILMFEVLDSLASFFQAVLTSPVYCCLIPVQTS